MEVNKGKNTRLQFKIRKEHKNRQFTKKKIQMTNTHKITKKNHFLTTSINKKKKKSRVHC